MGQMQRRPAGGDGELEASQGATLQGGQGGRVRIARHARPAVGWRDVVIAARDAEGMRRLPLTPGTASVLVLDGMLQDLDLPGRRALLRGCRRALGPGGRLRIYEVTPPAGLDLEALARWTGLEVAADALQPLAERNVVGLGTCLATLRIPPRPIGGEPVVSLLIDGSGAFAGESVESAARQDWPALEILLDAPAELVEALAAHEPRIRAGSLADATGEVILRVAPGEVLAPDAVSRLTRALRAFPDVTVAAAWRPFVDAEGAPRTTPRLALDDARVDGSGVLGVSLATGLDLVEGVATVAWRADEAPPAASEVGVIPGLLARGDLVWLSDPVAIRRVIVRPDAGARQRTARTVAFARDSGMWEPGSVPELLPRRLDVRPWWDAATRAAWATARGASDAEPHLRLAERAAESEPTLRAVEALVRSNRPADAARLAVEAVRRRPDVPALVVAAARALDAVGLVDDARFLRQSAETDAIVVAGRNGIDPRREPVRVEVSWSLWVVTGGLDAELTLELRADGPGRVRVRRDGESLGDVVLTGPGDSPRVSLDVEGIALGCLITLDVEGHAVTLTRAGVRILDPG